MKCWEPPFTGETPQEVFDKIENFQQNFSFPEEMELSENSREVIEGMLCDSMERVGWNGSKDFLKFKFFATIKDWNQLHNVTPPFVPQLGSNVDTSYFAPSIQNKDPMFAVPQEQQKEKN